MQVGFIEDEQQQCTADISSLTTVNVTTATSKKDDFTLEFEFDRVQLAEARAASPSDTIDASAPTPWKCIAFKQKQLRQRAERHNKLLKRMITAQGLLAKAILNGQYDLLRAIPKMRRALNNKENR